MNAAWAGKRIHVDKIVQKNLVGCCCRYNTINTYFTIYGNGVVKVRNGSQMILYMVMFRYFTPRSAPTPPGPLVPFPSSSIASKPRHFWSLVLLIFFRRGVQITWCSVTLTLTLPTPAIKKYCCTKPLPLEYQYCYS